LDDERKKVLVTAEATGFLVFIIIDEWWLVQIKG
jgi:hypothetical protein